MASSKPQLTFWQIWNLCFGFIGIQFGFALQNANVSRIFQTLGADLDIIPVLWIAGPITGLLVQPIIGHMSDKTWNRLGRRRPFLLAGAILGSTTLLIMPNSPSLWVAAGMLWIMDASLNIALGPSLALVSDMLSNKQRATGFAMQSFFIGSSAVIASALPWMLSNWGDVSNIAHNGTIPDSVTYAFYIGGGILFTSMVWSILSTSEYQPERFASFSHSDRLQDSTATAVNRDLRKPGFGCLGGGLVATITIYTSHLSSQLYILTIGIALFGALQLHAERLRHKGKTKNGFYQVTQDLLNMPSTMKHLALVQFLSWFALFSMWIYGTAAVTSHHFHTVDVTSSAYSEGADWVGILFAAYNGFAAVAAIFIPLIIKATNRIITHVICLCLGSAGLIAFTWIDNPRWLLASMVGVGFAWASILSLPYAILANAVPATKMGIYAGIFNFFIVIPQILAASILALVVHHIFNGQSIYALAFGGVCMLLAAIVMGFLKDEF